VGALEHFLDGCATEVSGRAALDPSQRTVLLDGAEPLVALYVLWN